ncbi:hypothetical protein FOCC_FOCC017420, partial [Frankliniella occidentalis]|uniref:Sterol O-acyltransferase 1-like n=1 Tax=Frankliniella occidentalis TaxID=133901 RepID=A0A9C6XAK7_FRAOC
MQLRGEEHTVTRNNNAVNELEAVRLRSTDDRRLSRSAPALAQVAEDQIRDLKAAMGETRRDGSPKADGAPGSRRKRHLPDKEFHVRNSLLSSLFFLDHINTIYHVAVMVLIVLVLKTLVTDLVEHGTVNLSMDLIWYSFGGFHRAIIIWLVMMASVLMQYVFFTNWASRRQQMP